MSGTELKKYFLCSGCCAQICCWHHHWQKRRDDKEDSERCWRQDPVQTRQETRVEIPSVRSKCNAFDQPAVVLLFIILKYFVLPVSFSPDDGVSPERVAQVMGQPDHCHHAVHLINELVQTAQVAASDFIVDAAKRMARLLPPLG